MPTTVCVIDTSKRLFPGTLKLDTTEALIEFFQSKPNLPLFAKAQNSMWSAGSFIIEAGDSTHISVKNEEPMTYDDFLDSFISNASYILQETVGKHTFFDGITEATPTVRLINLTNEYGVLTPYAILKLPMGDNIADNFWRPGNLVCSLDIESGEIQTIVSQNENTLIQHESLPGSERKFIGETFPFWKEISELNEDVALLHFLIAFSSTDIAITNEGPVVIEVNSGSALELPQIATGKGFLTDEVREFFKAAGSKIIK